MRQQNYSPGSRCHWSRIESKRFSLNCKASWTDKRTGNSQSDSLPQSAFTSFALQDRRSLSNNIWRHGRMPICTLLKSPCVSWSRSTLVVSIAILCDPILVREFEQIASGIVPGHSPREYRWAALNLRKRRKLRPELLSRIVPIPIQVDTFLNRWTLT